jgi:hypothetical protein
MIDKHLRMMLIACVAGGLLQACSGQDVAPKATPYEAGMAFKQEGRFDRAVPLLEQVAAQGRGFEVAQYQLALCKLELAHAAASPAEQAEQAASAAHWMLLAANSGLATAQEGAADLALSGIGMPVDQIEAGKWAVLFQHNPLRLQMGPRVMNPALSKRLQDTLTADDWAAATQRASTWSVTIQEVGPAAPDPRDRAAGRTPTPPPEQTGSRQRRPGY